MVPVTVLKCCTSTKLHSKDVLYVGDGSGVADCRERTDETTETRFLRSKKLLIPGCHSLHKAVKVKASFTVVSLRIIAANIKECEQFESFYKFVPKNTVHTNRSTNIHEIED